MEAIFTGLLVVLLVVLLLPERRPPLPPQPTVIFVERQPAPASGDSGCLPALVLIGLLAAVLMSLGT